jgi:hypothetical protein
MALAWASLTALDLSEINTTSLSASRERRMVSVMGLSKKTLKLNERGEQSPFNSQGICVLNQKF